MQIQRFLLRKKLIVKQDIPTDACRLFFFHLVNSTAFEIAITLCIVLNTVVMAMRYYQMPLQYEDGLEQANLVFAVIFNVECLFKLMGFGRFYFMTRWN